MFTGIQHNLFGHSKGISSAEIKTMKANADQLVSQSQDKLSKISSTSHNSSRFVSMQATGLRMQSMLSDTTHLDSIKQSNVLNHALKVQDYLNELEALPGLMR